MDENTARWRVFRLAVLAGWPWPGTYDWALHPRSRRPLAELLEQYPDAARRPERRPTPGGTVQIITREQWGARYSDGYEQYGHRAVGDLSRYFHHTVTRHLPESATIAYEVSQMRAVEAIGQQRFGHGMSYTLLGFPSGRWYEGVSISRISAHTGTGRNTTGAALCWVGNYEENRPTAALLRSTAEALVHGVSAGWWKSPTFTLAHRQIKATSCPGRFAFEQMGAISTAGLRLLETGSRDDDRGPIPTPWAPVVSPLLINERLALMGVRTAGGPTDYDRAAVKAYQEGQLFGGLVADGLWGPATEAHYQWVVALQSALVNIGARLARDGWYGPLTKFSVGRAQSALGLVADEIPGSITCAALKIRSHP